MDAFSIFMGGISVPGNTHNKQAKHVNTPVRYVLYFDPEWYSGIEKQTCHHPGISLFLYSRVGVDKSRLSEVLSPDQNLWAEFIIIIIDTCKSQWIMSRFYSHIGMTQTHSKCLKRYVHKPWCFMSPLGLRTACPWPHRPNCKQGI